MFEGTAEDAPRDASERRAAGPDVLAQALIACGREIAPLIEEGGRVEDTRKVIRRYVQAVRGAGVPPERALSAFKFMLSAQPGMHRLRRSDHVGRIAALARTAIEEYFDSAVNAPDEL